ncbi:hypothetical protein HMPREF0322_04388 [Desulfitobacterium hafniense DP7]|uniref:Uncharacterized protein n=1 Tax=Desulfitobacterium hafniense DP7 TaxID=537010 RepID=G9XTT0_DESHA|nr:hypothetical protein HMPREF0322_04388 [Desulfitobacterium hafniense DP7]
MESFPHIIKPPSRRAVFRIGSSAYGVGLNQFLMNNKGTKPIQGPVPLKAYKQNCQQILKQ